MAAGTNKHPAPSASNISINVSEGWFYMPGTAVDIVGDETDETWLHGVEDKQKCTALILDTD